MPDVKLVCTNAIEDPEGGLWLHTLDSLPGELWRGFPFKDVEFTNDKKIEVGQIVTLRMEE